VNSAISGGGGVSDNSLLVNFYWLLIMVAVVLVFCFWRSWYSSYFVKRTQGLSFLLCGSCGLRVL